MGLGDIQVELQKAETGPNLHSGLKEHEQDQWDQQSWIIRDKK